jgi:hypothetical protein
MRPDAAVWYQAEGTYRFILEGSYSFLDRHFCQAIGDGQGVPTPLDTWFAEPTVEGLAYSVPALISRADGAALFYYNVASDQEEIGGIRVSLVDPVTAETTPLVDGPMLPKENVDPMPVFLDGGGLRLYHTWGTVEEAPFGPGYSALDETGTVVLESYPLIESPGACGKEPVGECLMDPAFVALDDGRLALYFTANEYVDGVLHIAAIRRAFASD